MHKSVLGSSVGGFLLKQQKQQFQNAVIFAHFLVLVEAIFKENINSYL